MRGQYYRHPVVAVNLVVCFFKFEDYVLDFLEFPAAKIIFFKLL